MLKNSTYIQGESGPPLLVGFLFWTGFILSLPAFMFAAVLPITMTGFTGLSLNSAMLYFIGVGMQKFLVKGD